MENDKLTIEQKLEIARLATDLTKTFVGAKIPLVHIAKRTENSGKYDHSQFAIFDYLYDQITQKVTK
ncbi:MULTISPECIES: hypothetical protein [Xenorhabdus]|uniref:hypothetical protein n=1 Tax=Xenorhabdus TaxID=626 RepID=UPI000649D664|nr:MULTISPECIES: hypothetical protein [Xenorhabdus]KLU14809.1 hypothetical protein AAY47_14390 [Xenorhabdus griffiniae]KOP33789.1 hypothetical protein AFK69_08030 [Xenorhabdus sp. GDc328]